MLWDVLLEQASFEEGLLLLKSVGPVWLKFVSQASQDDNEKDAGYDHERKQSCPGRLKDQSTRRGPSRSNGSSQELAELKVTRVKQIELPWYESSHLVLQADRTNRVA